MSAKLLLIGLDAAEPSVFADLPTSFLASVKERGAFGRLVGTHGFLTDAVWPEIRTGSSAASTGVYFQPNQVPTGESRMRALRPHELQPERFYWNVAARSGLRVVAIDQPLTPVLPDGPAVELTEWGTHDRIGFAARPIDASAARVVDRHGRHPVRSCDRANNGRPRRKQRLLAEIRRGVSEKASLVSELLSLEPWDLFTAVFSECHCVGHQFWPTDPSARPEEVAAVYSELDAAVRTITDLAGGGSTAIFYCSHGMSPPDHGVRLVPEVLERMGLAHVRNPYRRRLNAAALGPVRDVVRRLVDPHRIRRAGFLPDWPLDDPRTSAIPLPNSRHGAIRLSISGRDPGGRIEAGSDSHRRVIDDIRREFAALVDVETGEPVVEEILSIEDVLGPDPHPDLPDLIIRFRRDNGLIGDCRSASLGTIRVPLKTHRTGEHGTPGAIWALGEGIEPGTDLGDVRTTDLAATVLTLLELAVPDWVDGAPVGGIVRR